MSNHQSNISRRQLVKSAAFAAAATSAFPYFAFGADEARPLKIGLIGCGGRGTQASENAHEADRNVKVVALADLYKDRLDNARKTLTDKGRTEIEDKNCFLGFDAFQKLLATDIDYVILATPPAYRPEHLEAAVNAGKNVFMEKPAAVDPAGIRKIIAAGEAAKGKGLSIVAGTQRRHHFGYVETIKRIHDGAIGDIVAGQIYWNDSAPDQPLQKKGMDDLEWMMRNWYNWRWLSGDHIVEQHVHNIDVATWAIGTHVEKVVAMGARHRRAIGDQYDCFAADMFFPKNVHVSSQCRQITGCTNEVSERMIGTKGMSNCNGWISSVKNFRAPRSKPYVQEHKDLIASIRAEKGLNEAKNVAESTLSGIMIRMSAYTGKAVTWDEAMKSEEVCQRPDYELTTENMWKHTPVPGTA